MSLLTAKEFEYQNLKSAIAFGWIGVAATLLVGTGEFLVHYSSSGYNGADHFTWLRNIPSVRASIGHGMMVFGMPLYIFGYYHLYLCLQPSHKVLSRMLLVLGVFAFVIGGVWAGSRVMLIEILKSENQVLIDFYKSHYEILVQILRVLVLLISVIWVYLILATKTIYSKWMVLVNPILMLGLVFIIYILFPVIGSFLVPAAMNVTHLILFSFSLKSLYKFLNHEKRF